VCILNTAFLPPEKKENPIHTHQKDVLLKTSHFEQEQLAEQSENQPESQPSQQKF
jgi:hypothetical protein